MKFGHAPVIALAGLLGSTLSLHAGSAEAADATPASFPARPLRMVVGLPAGGSTDRAAWIPAAEVARLPRAVLVDVGLALDRDTPASGHVPPQPVGGPVRR